MKIELTDEQIEDAVFSTLLSLEETFPNDKKLAKSIKRILSYTLRPDDWEMIYDEYWHEYSTLTVGSEWVDIPSKYPLIKGVHSSPEEQRITRARTGE